MNIPAARLLLLVIACCGLAPLYAEEAALPVLRGADHHVHIRSADAAAAWDALCERLPQACPGALRTAPVTTAADAVAWLDSAGLEKAALLSLGYMFGIPELADTPAASADLVRGENEYVASEAGKYPGRLVGFFSVNPLADYAVAEVSYWAGREELAGLKLHFANSNVDLRNPDDLAQLAKVFAPLDRSGLSAVVHLRNRNPEYGYEDAANFIEQVARTSPNVPLYIAHLGGWGGYDPGTDAALQAFLDAIGRGELDRNRVWFDIAAIVHPAIPSTGLEAVPGRLRQIGLDRVLFATDWDRPETEDRVALYRSALSLSDSEWAILLSNQAPYFSPGP